MSFGSAAYTAPEGSSVTVEVTLSADPERTVTIPLSKTEQGGVDPPDYSGVPSSVTFHEGQTSRTFTFTAAQDTEDDDGESVKLTFGTLPARVSEGTTDETTVTIGDDDDPRVTVGFGAYTYEIAEGSTRVFTVALNGDPERTITVPVVVAANQGYTIHRIRLASGVYPEMDNPWSRSLQDEAVLSFSIGHGASRTPPSQDHYRDWVLYLDDVTLPLSQATRFGRDFQWHGSAIQQIFADWTSSETNRGCAIPDLQQRPGRGCHAADQRLHGDGGR